MIITQIKADQLSARKAKDTLKASILTTLIGEAEMVGKNAQRETTDQEVLAVIKKFIKNIDETLKVRVLPELVSEKLILSEYVPKQMTGTALQSMVAASIMAVEKNSENALTVKDLGKVMKQIKQDWPDANFDGGEATQIIKSKLSV